MLPYSHQYKYEADKPGLTFVAMVGYNPNEALDFFERMAANSTAKMPEFLSTHPGEKLDRSNTQFTT
jgi:predicted Zn-dependent protease